MKSRVKLHCRVFVTDLSFFCQLPTLLSTIDVPFQLNEEDSFGIWPPLIKWDIVIGFLRTFFLKRMIKFTCPLTLLQCAWGE